MAFQPKNRASVDVFGCPWERANERPRSMAREAARELRVRLEREAGSAPQSRVHGQCALSSVRASADGWLVSDTGMRSMPVVAVHEEGQFVGALS